MTAFALIIFSLNIQEYFFPCSIYIVIYWQIQIPPSFITMHEIYNFGGGDAPFFQLPPFRDTGSTPLFNHMKYKSSTRAQCYGAA